MVMLPENGHQRGIKLLVLKEKELQNFGCITKMEGEERLLFHHQVA